MNPDNHNLTFEKAFDQLQSILEKMNSGTLSLQESLGLFEKGEKLMRHCETLLKAAEQKIEAISKGAEGVTILEPDQTPKTAPFSGEEVPF
jgi:exodeoxyribonuclease VII small subunit